MVQDLSKLNSQGDQEAEYVELYPSELNEIRSLSARLQSKYGFKQFNESVRSQFTHEVEDSFEKIGLIARVMWSLDVSGHNDQNLFHVPSISIVGRTQSEESTDFERMQQEIVSGELDGQVGYLREDGTRREDARKKDI